MTMLIALLLLIVDNVDDKVGDKVDCIVTVG